MFSEAKVTDIYDMPNSIAGNVRKKSLTLPKNPKDEAYMIRTFFKKHSILLMAVGTLLAVAAYEAYWLYGLYHTQQQVLTTQISSLLTEAEGYEYAEKLRKSLGTDNRILYTPSPNPQGKVISIAMDSLKGKPKEITVHRIDPDTQAGKVFIAGNFDIRRVDELFTLSLDSIGLPLPHHLCFFRDGQAMDSVSTAGYRPAKNDPVISITSNLNTGTYQLRFSSLSAHILGNMTGVLAVSAGILLMVIAAFGFIARALRQQRDLERMKNDFTGNITHELKTPIAVAYAASDTLLECDDLGNNPNIREEYLNIIKGQLDKLTGLVEMILSTTLENRKTLRLDLADTAVKPLLEEASAQTRLSAKKPCTTTVTVRPDDLTVRIDRKLMSSVLSTLLDNAVKYSGVQVDIRLDARQDEEKTRISITDNGIGIAPQDQAHIFEKFYRVPTGDVHNVKGYGIGLFFARSIVEKHGGRLTVESEPGKGSTFHITLPAE